MAYDCLVVGAGTAGCFAAYQLARRGFSVALAEVKPEEKIGEKVCGDAVGKHHFINVGLEPPKLGVDAVGLFKGVRVYSPSERYYVTAWGEGYALNRKAFGRRLLKLALSAGAELYAEHSAQKPIVEGAWVRGVKFTRKDGSTVEIEAKVIIDASGVAAAVRTRAPSEWWVSFRAPKGDFNITYREIVRVEGGLEPELARIYLNVEVAPGGYWWWFPKNEEELNVGLGIRWGVEGLSPKQRFEAFIRPRLREFKAKVVHRGGGLAPTRRTLSCMVWNGLVAIGDAAYTANPIHGGGIGPAMLSALKAAETIEEAFVNNGEASIEALWPYHRRYHEMYGAKQAALDVLRLYLQRLTNEDLEFVIEKGVVTDAELSTMGYEGRLSASILKKLGVALRLLSRPTLLSELKTVKSYMERAFELYKGFPDTPRQFEEWKAREERLFNQFVDWLNARVRH